VAEQAGQMLQRIVPDIRKTAELIQEIAANANEQDTGATQINTAIQQLDNVVQSNAAGAEEMASTTAHLSSQAEILDQAVSFFRFDRSSPHTAEPARKNPAMAQAALPMGRG
jgi:methyl-accepting chemotaxis protein